VNHLLEVLSRIQRLRWPKVSPSSVGGVNQLVVPKSYAGDIIVVLASCVAMSGCEQVADPQPGILP
jgi:hypothetical protein